METETNTQSSTATLTLTEAAANKVRTLISAEGRDDLRLRIGVELGGCAGYKYDLFFDEELVDGDIVSEFHGVELVVDPTSSLHLAGASIDYEDTIAKQGFVIDNPNAKSSCACGDSFC
jgi:iron-sulfur cluster assembly accessory protein